MNTEVGLERGCGLMPQLKSNCTTHEESAFLEESCLRGQSNDLISEIIDAAPASTETLRLIKGTTTATADLDFPSTGHLPQIAPSLLRQHPLEKIVRSLMYRMYSKFDLPKIRDNLNKHQQAELVSFYDTIQIQIAFKAKHIESIASKGFLNQHQIGSSSGFYAPKDRLALESNYLGIELASITSEKQDQHLLAILPKYAYGSPKDGFPAWTYMHHYHVYYGTLLAELKEEVMHRASFTQGDSLFNWEKIIKDNRIHTARLIQTIEEYNQQKGVDFTEAQIYGDIESRNIERLLINCFKDQGSRQVSAPELANQMNTQVHQCAPRVVNPQGKLNRISHLPRNPAKSLQFIAKPGKVIAVPGSTAAD